MNSLSDLFNCTKSEFKSTVYKGARLQLNKYGYTILERYDKAVDKFIIKTHYNYYQFLGDKCPVNKIVYIVRDVRDVMTSYYFYIFGFLGKERKRVEKFDHEHFRRFIEWRSEEYLIHLKSWLEFKKKNPNLICIVRYEDMYRDYIGTLMKIQKFVGWKVKNDYDVVQRRNVDYFKRHLLKGDNFSFYRKGVIGDWKNYFDKKSLMVVRKKCGSISEKFGYSI